jgi:hypothetical protein
VALAALDRVEARAKQVDQQWQRKARAGAVRSGPGPSSLQNGRPGQPLGGPEPGTGVE